MHDDDDGGEEKKEFPTTKVESETITSPIFIVGIFTNPLFKSAFGAENVELLMILTLPRETYVDARNRA